MDFPAILPLLLLGVGAGLVLPSIMKAVYFPCLLAQDMETKALSFAVTLFFAGQGVAYWILRGKRVQAHIYRMSTMLSVLLLGAAGIHVCTGASFAPGLLVPVPLLLGFSCGLELQRIYRTGKGLTGAAALAAGAAGGSMIHPFLYYQFLGPGSSLQAQAVVILCAGLCPLKPLDSPIPVAPSSMRAKLSCVAFTLYFLILLLLIVDRLKYVCLFGIYLGPAAAGFVLAGLALALFLRSPDFSGFSIGCCLLVWAAAAIPILDMCRSSSLYQDLKWTALACLPFGFIAGLGVDRLLVASPGIGMLAAAAGIMPAFLGAERLLFHREGSARLMICAVVLLVSIELLRRDDRRRLPFYHAGIGLICVALSFFLSRDFWFPGVSEEVVRIQGPNVELTYSLDRDRASEALKIFGRDPYERTDGPAQRERMAFMTSLFHPRPARMLVLGADTGAFVLEVARDPAVGTIEWVNPCREIADLSRRIFGHLPHLGVKTIEAPERVHLRRAEGTYDMILLPPSPLDGIRYSGLDTLEFYGEAHRLLGQGGMLCQWIFLHRIEPDNFTSQIAALSRVFPWLYVFVDHPFSCGPAVALVGSNRAIQFTDAYLKNRMKAAGRLEDFRRIGLRPEMFALTFISSKEVVETRLPARLQKDARVRTPLILPDREVFILGTNLRFLQGIKVQSFPLFPGDPPFDEGMSRSRIVHRVGGILLAEANDHLLVRWPGKGFDLTGGEALSRNETRILQKALALVPDDPYLLRLLTEKARSLSRKNHDENRFTLYETLLGLSPGHAEFRLDLAALHAALGRYDKAARLLEEAPSSNREERRFPIALAVLRARQGEWKEAGIILETLLLNSGPGQEHLSWIVALLDLLGGRTPRIPSQDPDQEEEWISSIILEFLLHYRGS